MIKNIKDSLKKIYSHLKSFFIIKEKNRAQQKVFFFDVTKLHYHDDATGIHRVVKNVMKRLPDYLQNYDFCIIYAKPYRGFYNVENDKQVIMHKDDIYLCVDLTCYYTVTNRIYYDRAYKSGIKVWFFLYDLIPLLHSETTVKESINLFEEWLKVILNYTGIISDSNAVLQELKKYISDNQLQYNPEILLRYVHLGSNFIKHENSLIKKNNDKTTFLMVSTVEPRKKYDLVVKAFNILWKKNIPVKLKIVGKPGWNNEETIQLIKNNPELNRCLFWYNTGISDEELSLLYEEADCVIMASIAEGFGLAIVEAASYNKPLIIRDIPVFREIANDSAYYFKTDQPEVLSNNIEEWLELYREEKNPKTDVEFITWDECTKRIVGIVAGENA